MDFEKEMLEFMLRLDPMQSRVAAAAILEQAQQQAQREFIADGEEVLAEAEREMKRAEAEGYTVERLALMFDYWHAKMIRYAHPTMLQQLYRPAAIGFHKPRPPVRMAGYVDDPVAGNAPAQSLEARLKARATKAEVA
jgi:hypothetical protein